jgi:hypothetical protein
MIWDKEDMEKEEVTNVYNIVKMVYYFITDLSIIIYLLIELFWQIILKQSLMWIFKQCISSGDLGPAGIAGITIGAVAVAGALAVTVFFCYWVHQKQKQADATAYGSPAGITRIPQFRTK